MADRGLIDRGFDAFDRLSTREKIMVGGLIGAVMLTMVALVWLLVGKKLDTLAERNRNMVATLDKIDQQKADYIRSKARLAAYERQLDQNKVKLIKLMEDEASALEFEIEDFKESKRILTENYRRKRGRTGDKTVVKDLVERSQTATIRRISLEQLTKFLGRLEGRREPIKVTQLNIKTNTADRQQLREIRMTVATYRNEEVED